MKKKKPKCSQYVDGACMSLGADCFKGADNFCSKNPKPIEEVCPLMCDINKRKKSRNKT